VADVTRLHLTQELIYKVPTSCNNSTRSSRHS